MWTYLRAQFGDRELVREMDAVVDRVSAGRSFRQLRTVAHDLEEWASALRPDQTNELEALLAARFGSATAIASEAQRQRIIERGRIRTAEEYRLISARVEAIYADPSHRGELEMLNALLVRVANYRKLPGD